MTTVKVRQVVKELVEDRNILIVSATGRPAGYYVPTTTEEFRQGVGQLVNRVRSLAGRIRAMDRRAYEEIFGQGRMV